MENYFEKHKKLISFILFFLYVGCILLCAQETPRKYVAYHTMDSITVDGNPNESSWKNAPWSDYFIDIEGVKKPTYDTRMKMLWDNENIYFFAELKEPHVWGYLKEHDTIIFYNNDFELFIDPDGDTHDYYEYEMNALNTVWDLYLSRPYRNHGKVLGGWDFKGLKSAVHVKGSLNDPSDTDEGWSVEIAIPWSFHTPPGGKTEIPKDDFWRVNFSRVNWDFDVTNGVYSRKKDEKTGQYLHENNWVWSPQQVINMHEPERWGYVYFSSNPVGENEASFDIPKDDHIKWYLYELFRDLINEDQQKIQWKSAEGELFGDAKKILDKSIVPHLEKHTYGFTIWTKSPFTNEILSINSEGRFRAYKK